MNYNKAVNIIAGIFLGLAIFNTWPYCFYQLLRWIVSLAAIYNAYIYYLNKENKGLYFMVGVATLFNPISPISFSRDTWVFIDFIVAIIMFAGAYEEKPIIQK